MNPALIIATARRVLLQLRHDPRTVVLLIAVPALLMVLLRYVFDSKSVFSGSAPALLGIFPFLLIFPRHLDYHVARAIIRRARTSDQ